jgi:hypothetical protein
MEDLPNGYNVTLHRTLSPSRPYGSVQAGDYCEQHLDNLRRKDALRGAETTEISVRLGSYSASHFEGSALCTARYCWRTLKEGFIVLLIGSEYMQLK